MKKIELLAPVGNMEVLISAIHAGADAVYLAGKSYGARKFANNFTNEELEKAIKYSHLYGVKVYITVNTMIYETEIEDFLAYIEFLHQIDVDALIMQDIGMIKLVKQTYPNLEIHASTQCHNHNQAGILSLKELGVERVVLAREMTLDEINNIDVDIEKEVFVYGALCVCYSGCCLFSSLNGGRSGNRGECVGSCRLPYKLVENDKVIPLEEKYLLSTKELNTINNLKQLLDSNIHSLKIEGRMKSKSYVAYIVKLYRTLIDKYYNNEELKLTKEELTNLKKLYNREFTEGYLFNAKSIMNRKTPNHIGVPLGRIIKLDKDKIYLKLEADNLYQEDGIRFKSQDKGMIINKLYNEKNLLVNHILKNNIAIIDNKIGLTKKDIVLKTIDNNLIKQIDKYEEKKININYQVKAKLNDYLEITITDNLNEYTIKEDIITKSNNIKITKQDIIEKLSKLGNTPFKVNNIDINIDDNIFIPLSKLNEIRRTLVDKLIFLRENNKKEVIINKLPNYNYQNKNTTYNLNVLARTEEQLEVCLNKNINNIYLTDYNLYLKYKDKYKNIYYRTKRVNNHNLEFNQDNLLITELGGIYKYHKNNNIVSDYYLNIANHNSIEYLDSLNVDRITLSVELNDKEIETIMTKNNYNTELIIYGRIELMIMKYCPLKELINNCSICKTNSNKYYLLNKDNYKYPILRDNCLTHIMHYENINKISNIPTYKKLNILSYRIELFDENKKEVEELINKVKVLIN